MKWMRGYGTKLVWNLGFSSSKSSNPIIQSSNTNAKHVPKDSKQICQNEWWQSNKTVWQNSACALDQETQWCPRSMHHQIAMKQSLTAGRREKRWKDVCKLLTPSKNTPRFTCCWNEAQWGDDLGNQPVQVGVSWTLDVQVPAANIVEGLVVLKKMRTRSMRGKRAITTTTTRRRRRRRTTTTTRRTTTYIHVYIYIYIYTTRDRIRKTSSIHDGHVSVLQEGMDAPNTGWFLVETFDWKLVWKLHLNVWFTSRTPGTFMFQNENVPRSSTVL